MNIKEALEEMEVREDSSNYEKLKAVLEYEGIIGYTGSIVRAIEEIYNVKLED